MSIHLTAVLMLAIITIMFLIYGLWQSVKPRSRDDYEWVFLR